MKSIDFTWLNNRNNQNRTWMIENGFDLKLKKLRGFQDELYKKTLSQNPNMSKDGAFLLAHLTKHGIKNVIIPTDIILSRSDRKLLGRLSPFQYLKFETHENINKVIAIFRAQSIKKTRIKQSESAKRSWTPERRKQNSEIMLKRYKNPRERRRTQQNSLRHQAWKRTSTVFNMLFSEDDSF